MIPPGRVRYLAEIAETVRGYHAATDDGRATPARRAPAPPQPPASSSATSVDEALDRPPRAPLPAADAELPDGRARRDGRGATPATSSVVRVRDREIRTPLTPGDAVRHPDPPCRAAPATPTTASCVRFLRVENLPGRFPFTAGVFPFKREGEDPARMFAGEGDPFRTNRRFHLLAEGQPATRLSTAFDSVTLYGRDPDPRPDVYGKVGTSGVSIATLDDMKVLYDGFDLLRPDDVGVDDDQRPGADDPRVVPQHRDRPAARRLREREGREPDDAEREELAAYALATCAAPCRPTSSRRTRARTPASSPPSSRCA